MNYTLLIFGFTWLIGNAFALSTNHVVLPLTSEYTAELQKSLGKSFQKMVDQTDFFVKSETNSETTCSIPLLNNAQVILKPRKKECIDASVASTPTDYVLTIHVAEQKDFGWICVKLLAECKKFEGLSTLPLRDIVLDHYNSQPPHPGYDAELTADHRGTIDAMFGNREDNLSALAKNGFVVLDSAMKTSSNTMKNLDKILVEKTGQDKSIRSDIVCFLDKDEAKACGLQDQFKLLMGIAAYLNEHLDFEETEYPPISPGTKRRPLTNPRHIQAAEYRNGDFYKSHSDNSLTEANIRNNFRCYTCILYCNDEWKKDLDGGALRIYPDSLKFAKPTDAEKHCDFVDINPINGRLLIFDSRLVHSVEKVNSEKKRLALTLWIKRPEKNGVRGEMFDAKRWSENSASKYLN